MSAPKKVCLKEGPAEVRELEATSVPTSEGSSINKLTNEAKDSSEGNTKDVKGYLVYSTQRLGKGSYASVWRAKHKATGMEAAAKTVSLSKLSEDCKERMMQELAILRKVDHPNIVKLHDQAYTQSRLIFFLEFCKGGDLHRYLKKRGRLHNDSAKRVIRQLASGLHYMWRRNIIHRDLKPQNLLLTEPSISRGTLKISDFGFARYIKNEVGGSMDLAKTLCGSPLYMAPEILNQQEYTGAVDLWSTGAVLFECLYASPPFNASNIVSLQAALKKGFEFPDNAITKGLPDELKELLAGLLKVDPAERMDHQTFFHHPWFYKEGLYEEDDSPIEVDLEPLSSKNKPPCTFEERPEEAEEEAASTSSGASAGLLTQAFADGTAKQARSDALSSEGVAEDEVISNGNEEPIPCTRSERTATVLSLTKDLFHHCNKLSGNGKYEEALVLALYASDVIGSERREVQTAYKDEFPAGTPPVISPADKATSLAAPGSLTTQREWLAHLDELFTANVRRLDLLVREMPVETMRTEGSIPRSALGDLLVGPRQINWNIPLQVMLNLARQGAIDASEAESSCDYESANKELARSIRLFHHCCSREETARIRANIQGAKGHMECRLRQIRIRLGYTT